MDVCWKNEGIQLRRNEKKILNDLNTDKNGRLRFHINDDKGKRKKRIQTREEKIFVLTNDCLTGDPSIHDLSMTQVPLLKYFFQQPLSKYFNIFSNYLYQK